MTDNNGVEWEEPRKLGTPHPLLRKPLKWVPILEPLMEHPKRWAVVERSATAGRAGNIASYLRRPSTALPPGRWQFTSRVTPAGGAVYARYLGSEGDE